MTLTLTPDFSYSGDEIVPHTRAQEKSIKT